MGTPSFQTLDQETRYSGHWIVAQQGMGKTAALINMIVADLQRDACVIVMDAKNDLTEAVRHLNLGSRLIVLDPADTPFALNPLDVPKTDTRRAVDQVEYIFGAMLGASVTPKQQALLRSLLRACIIGIPDPTLLTIQDLIISGPDKYRPFIQHMPDDLQHLFDTTKYGEWSSYDATRGELKWRLRLLLESELIQRIFMSPRTRFRIGEAMNAGKIVVIDNAQSKLHPDGSVFLGRYFIAQIWAAATARAAKPRDPKKPVFVYIDEADTVIDRKVAEIIDRCRSQNIGLILAHQRAKQIEDTNVLSALENCAIKMVNVKAEASYFSKLMDIPEERIRTLDRGFFATEIRGQPPCIIQVPKPSIPFRHMTPAEEAALTRRMIDRYGILETEPQASPPTPAPPPTAPMAAPTIPSQPSSPSAKPSPQPRTDEADSW